MATKFKKAASKRSKTTLGYLRVRNVNAVLDRMETEARSELADHEAHGAEELSTAWRARLTGLAELREALAGELVSTRR